MWAEAESAQGVQIGAARPDLRGQSRTEVERRIAECRKAGLVTAARKLERELK